MRVAFARDAVDLRTTGIAEAEEPCSLVERLPGRVVEGRAEESGFATAILHVEEQRVATARQQAEEGRLDRIRLEVERRNVAMQMVDRGQG